MYCHVLLKALTMILCLLSTSNWAKCNPRIWINLISVQGNKACIFVIKKRMFSYPAHSLLYLPVDQKR